MFGKLSVLLWKQGDRLCFCCHISLPQNEKKITFELSVMVSFYSCLFHLCSPLYKDNFLKGICNLLTAVVMRGRESNDGGERNREGEREEEERVKEV